MIRASYSAALFETTDVSVKEYGIIALLGVTKTTLALAPYFRQAPSKYISHVGLTISVVKTSSLGKSS